MVYGQPNVEDKRTIYTSKKHLLIFYDIFIEFIFVFVEHFTINMITKQQISRSVMRKPEAAGTRKCFLDDE